MQDPEDFPANTWRRRLLILVLAVGTAGTVLVYVLRAPPGVPRRMPAAEAPAPDAPPCSAGQTTGCVGGMAQVIVAPGAVGAAASGAASASPR